MSHFEKPIYPVRLGKKKDIPAGLYTKCPISGETIFTKELEANLMVVPSSGYHFPIPANQRIEALIDPGTWKEIASDVCSSDPLEFTDSQSYKDRLVRYEKESGMNEAVIAGSGKIHGIPVSLAVMDFRFCGGTLGSATGERLTRAIEFALERKVPCIIFSTSGGARMQEGILSLMQMAKTSAALGRLAEAGLPYISVLTNHHGWRLGQLCHAGRRDHRRAWRPHWFCRSARDKGNHQADPAARFSERGVPPSARID